MSMDITSLLSLQARSRRNARAQLRALRRRRADAAAAARVPASAAGGTDGLADAARVFRAPHTRLGDR